MSSFAWGLVAGLFLGFMLGIMTVVVLAISDDPIFPGEEEERYESDKQK